MSLISETFRRLRAEKRGAFIPFVVLGDPDFNTSKKILEVLAKHADILELGFPFSDPIADGKRVQAADERALKSGINTEKCFSLIRHVKRQNKNVPVSLLLYYNLVYSNGTENFLRKAKKAGVDAVLIADMPLEESKEFNRLCRKHGIEEVFIVAPTTGAKRMRSILSRVNGFVYIVGVLGVTGERKTLGKGGIGIALKIKKLSKIPACVGFGISNPGQARKIISSGADGVIVGSALEAVIEKNLRNKKRLLREVEKFAEKFKAAASGRETRKSAAGHKFKGAEGGRHGRRKRN